MTDAERTLYVSASLCTASGRTAEVWQRLLEKLAEAAAAVLADPHNTGLHGLALAAARFARTPPLAAARHSGNAPALQALLRDELDRATRALAALRPPPPDVPAHEGPARPARPLPYMD